MYAITNGRSVGLVYIDRMSNRNENFASVNYVNCYTEENNYVKIIIN